MADRGMPVAARLLDGRVIKGWTLNIRPEGTFNMLEEGCSSPTWIKTCELKAIFFIKSLEGNPSHDERKDFERRSGPGTKIWVEFKDGEQLAGSSTSYSPEKDGFYLFPTDPDSNINMAYIVGTAVKKVRTGAFAERAARRYQTGRGSRRNIPAFSPEKWDELFEAPRL